MSTQEVIKRNDVVEEDHYPGLPVGPAGMVDAIDLAMGFLEHGPFFSANWRIASMSTMCGCHGFVMLMLAKYAIAQEKRLKLIMNAGISNAAKRIKQAILKKELTFSADEFFHKDDSPHYHFLFPFGGIRMVCVGNLSSYDATPELRSFIKFVYGGGGAKEEFSLFVEVLEGLYKKETEFVKSKISPLNCVPNHFWVREFFKTEGIAPQQEEMF